MGLFSKKDKSAVRDALEILESVDKEALECAWEAYAHIKTISEEYDHDYEPTLKLAKNTWPALEKVVEYDGNFRKFKNKEKDLLESLKQGFLAYDDIMHVLIDHHDDTQEAKELYERHPRLHDIVPEKYDNSKQVIEVLLEFIRDYRWRLEHFAEDHSEYI